MLICHQPRPPFSLLLPLLLMLPPLLLHICRCPPACCRCHLLQGNLVSEFGFGSAKQAAMDLVDSFEPTYWLTQLRVAGDELRLLRAYPGKWQVRKIIR